MASSCHYSFPIVYKSAQIQYLHPHPIPNPNHPKPHSSNWLNILTMASKATLFLAVNLLFFVLANAKCATPPPATPPPAPPPPPPPKSSCPTPPATPPATPPLTPPTMPPVTPPSSSNCPVDALKLGACADVLGLLKGINIGTVPTSSCCSLLGGLVDLEAAVCLCTALKANILGINLNLPINLSLVLNYCGKDVPSGYQCS